jgi:pSer/pThr/pTyr-binding forkhead associated (FHA) protein
MILYLQHDRGDGEIDTYHLKPGRRYHIGRGSTCEVRILDLKLSRKHAALEWEDGAWRFVDLGSTNGCLINGEEAVGAAVITPGTRLELGQTVLTASRLATLDEDPDAPAAPAPRASGELLPDEESSAATLPVGQAVEPRKPVIPAARPTPIPAVVPTPRPASGTPGSASLQTPTAKVEAGPANVFVTVLGRRIGPLTRPQARELKSRELRGTLKPEDLDGLPQG